MAQQSSFGPWCLLPSGAFALFLTLGMAASCGDLGPASDGMPPDPEGPALPMVASAVMANPPPLSGGTLLITRDDATAVAADPDRDSVWLVDLPNQRVRARVRMAAGAEPGRIVEDSSGQIHVVLRRAGQVVTLNPQSGEIAFSRSVCPAPRGIAYDAASDSLHVACAGGELVTLKAQGGDPVRTLLLDRDLRDVVMKGDHLLISRFRSAELLELDAAGALLGRVKPGVFSGSEHVNTSPTTAWRLIALPSGQVAMLHQQAVDGAAAASIGWSAGGPCGSVGIVSPAVTLFNGASDAMKPSGVQASVIRHASLVIDAAVSPDGRSLWWVSPATDQNINEIIISFRVSNVDLPTLSPGHCNFPGLGRLTKDGQVVALALNSKNMLYVQGRNPAQLFLIDLAQSTSSSSPIPPIRFPDAEDMSNDGHQLFHTATHARIACASCHPEAGDDGHVWSFNPVGPRRTQSLRGGLLATAPFHWDGSLKDMAGVLNETFVKRMLAPSVSVHDADAVGKWIDAQPTEPKGPARDPQAAERGRQLFSDPTVGCISCHAGEHFTNNQNAQIGTGLVPLQVPSLRSVSDRAPYMHTGCASTLRARFDPACGGDMHGATSQLTVGQLDDLIAYLETL